MLRLARASAAFRISLDVSMLHDKPIVRFCQYVSIDHCRVVEKAHPHLMNVARVAVAHTQSPPSVSSTAVMGPGYQPRPKRVFAAGAPCNIPNDYGVAVHMIWAEDERAVAPCSGMDWYFGSFTYCSKLLQSMTGWAVGAPLGLRICVKWHRGEVASEQAPSKTSHFDKAPNLWSATKSTILARPVARATLWTGPPFYADKVTGNEGYRRPGLERLLADARQKKIDVVLCWKLDRAGFAHWLDTRKTAPPWLRPLAPALESAPAKVAPGNPD